MSKFFWNFGFISYKTGTLNSQTKCNTLMIMIKKCCYGKKIQSTLVGREIYPCLYAKARAFNRINRYNFGSLAIDTCEGIKT